MSDDNGTGTNGTGQQGDPQAGQGAPGTGQDPAGTAPKPTAPPNGQQQGADDGGQDPADTIARLERELADARKEAGKTRTTAKQRAADEARQDLTQQLLGILDPSKAGQQATPEELTQQLEAEQAKARTTAVELAVYRTARDAGGDPDALLDSRSFAAAIADLDPSDTAAVRAAVEQAVADNPKLAAEQQPAGPARSGSEFTGPPNAGVTPQQFAAMNYRQRAELMQTDPDTYRRLAGTQ
ncbi:hypothetical protein ACNYS0_20185 [Streptomyces sp. BH034]|uniref:hypothetical protein n=1 Tax=Streptomyces sp. BH034 TaxID=3402626 RepID=UPI003BB53BD7